jgi:hypothetical protein
VVKCFLRPARTPDPQSPHEPGHLVPTDIVARPAGGLGELAPPIDRVVLLPEPLELGSEGGRH